MENKLLMLITIVLLLVRCLPDPLEVDQVPVLERKIVVSSQLVPTQSVAVLLTSSFGALDANNDSDPQALLNQIAVNDAIVTIEGNGLLDTLNFLGNGVYGSTSIDFVTGTFYHLTAQSPTAGIINAVTQVKEQVLFNTINATIDDNGFDTLANIDYSFKDLPGRNFYMVNVQHISVKEPPKPEDLLNPDIFTTLTTDDPSHDEKIIGESFKVFFRRDFIPGDTILVQLANISEDYYYFLDSQRNNRFNFSNFLGEPLNYSTNVHGGLGWFTLHVPDVRLIIVDP